MGGRSEGALRRAARFAAVWQPTPLPIAQLVERQAALRKACAVAGREPPPTRMSFRVEIRTITGKAPPAGNPQPAGTRTPPQGCPDIPPSHADDGLSGTP